ETKTAFVGQGDELLRFLGVDRERLLGEDVLAGAQRPADDVSVRLVNREVEDAVDVAVVEDRVEDLDGVGVRLQRLAVGLRDVAASDDGDAQRVGHSLASSASSHSRFSAAASIGLRSVGSSSQDSQPS